MSVEFFKKIKKKFDEASEDIFFRVCNKDEDTMEVVSAEITEDRLSQNENIIDYILDLYNHNNFEELKSDIENDTNLFWSDEGHLGKGLYYAGVCCETSMSALASYSNSRSWHKYEDAVIRVFEGNFNGDCNDGQVAIPSSVLFDLPASLLEREDVVEFIDYLLYGGEVQ